MQLSPVTALLAATLFCAPAAANTTVLDFSGDICGVAGNTACGNYSQIGQNYGDIAGQLDVSHRSFVSSTGLTFEPYLKHWAASYSDLNGVAWGGGGATGYTSEITLNPGAGLMVWINGLDFGDYANRNNGSSALILDGLTQAVLWSSGAFDPGLTATHFSPAVGSANGLILRWGPDGYDVGVDNISITLAPVPEPGSVALWLAGLGALVMRRRRGQRR